MTTGIQDATLLPGVFWYDPDTQSTKRIIVVELIDRIVRLEHWMPSTLIGLDNAASYQRFDPGSFSINRC
ncbi:MAG: hypothetical protein IPN42_00065 [Methylococcaceae bacterium]|nr:hypothetical protein [Methylococcaceae bacterium]